MIVLPQGKGFIEPAPSPDVTPPTLSSATAGTATPDGATNFGVTTNEGNGTLYWAIVTNGGSCTDAQLKSGSGGDIVSGKSGNQAVNSSGAQTIASVTGLSSSTTYQIKFLQRDAAGNDSSQASVSLTTSSYATWNPSDKSANITLSGGDLVTTGASSGWKSARATVGKTSGKWYFEVTYTTKVNQLIVGVTDGTLSMATYLGSSAASYAYESSTGNKFNNAVNLSFGATFAQGDIIGVAFDVGAGKLWWSKNGTWQASGDPAAGTNAAYTGLSGTVYPGISLFGAADVATTNFGASAFSYTTPSGFNSGVY